MSDFRWYAVHTYSRHETKALKALQEKIRNFSWAERFGEILVPTESDLADIGLMMPARPSADGKFYPALLLLQMNIDVTDKAVGADMFKLVTTTPNITGFVGNAARPTPFKGKGKFAPPRDIS